MTNLLAVVSATVQRVAQCQLESIERMRLLTSFSQLDMS